MSYEIKGDKELIRQLMKSADVGDIKKVVKRNGAQMHNSAQRNASFGRYQTGTTKRSIQIELIDDGLTAKVAPTTEYSPYLEYGTRYMAAQPFIRPSYEKQRDVFISDLKKLLK